MADLKAIESHVDSHNEFSTYQFEQKLQEENNSIQPATTSKVPNVAREAGKYFEYCVLDAFKQYADTSGETAPDELEQLFSKPELVSFGNIIKTAARDIVKYWAEKLKEELEAKNITISMIADITTPGGKVIGNPRGDLEIKFKDMKMEPIILELKWGMNKKNDISYFHVVSEETLFGGGYKEFLKTNWEKIWTNTLRREVWIRQVGGVQFFNFLQQKQQAENIFGYLLRKNIARETYSSKHIIRASQTFKGSKATVEIADIDALEQRYNKVAIQRRSGRQSVKIKTPEGKDVSLRFAKIIASPGTKSSQEIGGIGVSKFNAQKLGTAVFTKKGLQSAKTGADARSARALKGIDSAAFSFQMYIKARAFSDVAFAISN